MGVDMDLMEAEFRMPKENKSEALEEIYSLMGQSNSLGIKGQGFSYMNHAYPEDWECFEDAMRAWRFPVETDEEGNVVDIDFTGEKMGDEKYLFNSIAKFVDDDSYIVLNTPGFDGGVGYKFDGDSAKYQEIEVENKINW